jgi:hypothetical protein
MRLTDHGAPRALGLDVPRHRFEHTGGRFTSRTSTVVTFTPQRSVTSSNGMRSDALISSRFDRTSSSTMSTTLRSGVVATFCAATAKFCTSSTDMDGSTTL